MEYHGKLYGKMGRRLIPLTLTSEDVDRMQLAIQDRERQIEEMEICHAAAMLHTQAIVDDANAMIAAIRNLRDVAGRFHTQQATERLFALLPENVLDVAPPPQRPACEKDVPGG